MVTLVRRLLIASLLTAGLFSGLLSGQSTLHFKTRVIETPSAGPLETLSTFGRNHLLIQFQSPPSARTIAELTRRGISVLQDVPDNGLLVSLDGRVSVLNLGVTYAAPMAAADKISPLITGGGFMLVEFHPDVDMNAARGLVLNLGISLLENPDLSPHHLMIHVTSSTEVVALANRDEVGYIFPASRNLVNGVATRACVGALTTNGTTAQSIPTYGPGWDGPGLGSAMVGYVFSKMTAQLDPGAAEAVIEAAMAEWAKAVKVTWVPNSSATAPATVNILFATYDHGDGFPFAGPGGILAHTFYPAPPNPEPIAGDMHFNDSETWKIGANTDLFSVALHELGHSLGLGHSDDPAAVMYPYYQTVTQLSPLDISTVQTLYAAQTTVPVTPPVTVAPATVTLAINVPASTTTASSMSFSGSTSGGKGAVVVAWSTAQGSSGTASGATSWTIASVPLVTGSNTVTITATDSVSHVSQSFSITRASTSTPLVVAPPVVTPPPATPPVVTPPVVAPPTGTNTTPPSLTINTPSSTSISTSSSSIAFTGTSSDNVGVTAVTWSTNTGGAGTAAGTAQWSASIPLLVGSNTVTVRATDTAGNTAWRSVVVTRN